MPEANPITTARDAVEAIPRDFPDGWYVNAKDALAALDVLDHEAAVEEWRCPKHPRSTGREGGRCSFEAIGRARTCAEPFARVLVVPFRSEGGDHA